MFRVVVSLPVMDVKLAKERIDSEMDGIVGAGNVSLLTVSNDSVVVSLDVYVTVSLDPAATEVPTEMVKLASTEVPLVISGVGEDALVSVAVTASVDVKLPTLGLEMPAPSETVETIAPPEMTVTDVPTEIVSLPRGGVVEYTSADAGGVI